ncbi:MAG: hypothetical protein FWH12_02880 [Treponema sp.]|nr:hypothetical protein [Treponema sp.]
MDEHTNTVGGYKKILDLSYEEVSAVCSNLARGCEKQRLNAEKEAFTTLAEYFKSQRSCLKDPGQEALRAESPLTRASRMLDLDMGSWIPSAKEAAQKQGDRGAQRSIVWSEKVSTMMRSLYRRYAKEGEAMLENTSIYVCQTCGFIYLGDSRPRVCPVCKVPRRMLVSVERRVY